MTVRDRNHLSTDSPPSYVAECCGCQRDQELLADTTAWPAVLQYRRLHRDGEIDAAGFIEQVSIAVRASIDRAALLTELRAALDALTRDHAEGGPHFGSNRLHRLRLHASLDSLEPALPYEPPGTTVPLSWATLAACLNPATGDATGVWVTSLDDILGSIRAERLGPHGRAAHWLANPRPMRSAFIRPWLQ